MLAFAIYILKSQEDALEVVNDVMLKLWDKREQLGPFDQDAHTRLKSYAFQATKNAALNHLRKQKKTWMQLEDYDAPTSETPQSVMEDKVNTELLANWTSELPPKCQQIFKMSRIDALSNKEIAELLEISTKTVENQMTKALNFFRKKLNYE